MPRLRKLDPAELQDHLEKYPDVTGLERAKHFGVSPALISRTMKRLEFARAEDVVLNVAKKVNRRCLSVMDRAYRNAAIVAGELNFLNEKIPKAAGEDREKLVKSRLDHIAEDRKLSDSLVNAARAMVHIDQVTILQRTIEDIFEKLDPEVKNEFLTELRKRRHLNSVIGAVDRDSV